MGKKIIIVAESSALDLKDKLVEFMAGKGYEFVDGTDGEMTYIEAGDKIGKAVSEKKFDFGIVLCGSGMGVNLVANCYPGVYCGLCESPHTAKTARTITNCNVLAMGCNIVAHDLACRMVETFMETDFTEGFDTAEAAKFKEFFAEMEGIDASTHK